MKRLTPLLFLLPFAGQVDAQSTLIHRDTRTDRTAVKSMRAHAPDQNAGGEDRGGGCIYSEDFESGAIPPGWEIGAPVEQYSDAPTNPVPQGTFVDAWMVGTENQANNGGYFNVPNEPPGNLFAYANDDGDPCNCDLEDIGLVTPSYDFTGLSGIGLRARIWHDGQYASSTGSIQASMNGGEWSTIYTLAEASGWQNIAVVLTAYQDQPDVRFRFQWADGGGWGTGIAVDDVCITQLPANDLALTGAWLVPDPANYEDATVRNIEYRNLPLSETIPLSVSAPMVNNGSGTQSEVILSVYIEQNGNTYGPFTSGSTTLDPGQRDTLVVNTGWLANSTGEVTVTFTVGSSDPDDDFALDNTVVETYQVTGMPTAEGANAMGCDHGNLDGFTYLSTDADSASYDALGTRFQIEGTGNMAYGLGIGFSDRSRPGTLFNVYLLDDNGELASLLDQELQPGDLNATGGSHFRTLLFESPVELDPGMDYRVFVENITQDRVAVGLSGKVTPGGLLGHEINDTQNTIYIGFGNPALMVRLYLSEAVGIDQAAPAPMSFTLRPNPSQEVCVLRFQLEQGTALRCSVNDIHGRMIQVRDLGQRAAGQNEVELDVSGLAAGTYHITLVGEGVNAHQKLMVIR